jgi:hypothetical protein
LESAHEIGSVCLLGWVLRGVVVDVVVLVARVCEETLELVTELIGHSEVERTEVGAKGLVDQVFIDTEEEGSWLVARWLAVADPEESVCLALTVDDFHCRGHGLNMYFEALNFSWVLSLSAVLSD